MIRGGQKKIIAAIIKKCQSNPLLIPDGSGIPLGGKLTGYGKIRLKREGIRIVYRPKQHHGNILVEIIAIGPREDLVVHELAKKRIRDVERERNDQKKDG